MSIDLEHRGAFMLTLTRSLPRRNSEAIATPAEPASYRACPRNDMNLDPAFFEIRSAPEVLGCGKRRTNDLCRHGVDPGVAVKDMLRVRYTVRL